MLLLDLLKLNPEVLLDKEDLDKFMFCTADLGDEGYVRIMYYGKQVKLHRAIMNFPKEDIDHINRIKIDNRKENLRKATSLQNNINKGVRSDNTSGYKGVSFYKGTGKWLAQIRAKGAKLNLGYYKTPQAAALAYNRAAIKYHGESAVLNSIEELLS